MEKEVVRKTRPILLLLQFGWIKFTKNSRFVPGFVYPKTDADGKRRALKILCDGFTANEKNQYHDFEINIADRLKMKSDLKALQTFNERFNFSFE